MDETIRDIYDAIKKGAAEINETDTEREIIVGQPLKGDDATNFLQWLINASQRVQGGQISADEAMKEIKQRIVAEDETPPQ